MHAQAQSGLAAPGMGVKGLLKALSDIQHDACASDYRGLRMGIDASCFLHRGVHGCGEALLDGQEGDAPLFGPLLEVCRALRAAGVEPLAVFDGGRLGAKRGVHALRQLKREDNTAVPGCVGQRICAV
ncbi:unnamed protein product [Prorocentrum cordatum]|uniref:Exonuclease 1 n=1 Tax=Prorocentrum cordatum TaxID=2364126 RepID=A0ABN9VU76_9DINO|nr:unnamed protein product [Polarella glacialis]